MVSEKSVDKDTYGTGIFEHCAIVLWSGLGVDLLMRSSRVARSPRLVRNRYLPIVWRIWLTVDVVGCVYLETGAAGVTHVNVRSSSQPSHLYVNRAEESNRRYIKFVNKTIAKIETILKVILTAKDPPAGLVQNYFFLVADKSVANFLKVLELKVPLLLLQN